MSYILEALKKSERERARGNIPTLETISSSGGGRRAMWLGVLIGAGALCSVAAVAWLVKDRFIQTPAAPVSDQASVPAADTQQPVDAQSETRIQVQSASAAAPAEEREEVLPEVRPEAEPEHRKEAAREITPRRVIDISELDPAARQRIQDLTVNVVSYSEVPERRFVMLNQRILRESESLGDGIVVKRILPNGALLGIGNYEIVVGPD